MTLNVKLLRRIQNKIEKHAEQFDMQSYCDLNTECGTTACIAGWAAIMTDKTIAERVKAEQKKFQQYIKAGGEDWEYQACIMPSNEEFIETGAKAIGIGDAMEEKQGWCGTYKDNLWRRLFIDENWSDKRRGQFSAAKTPKGRARVAIRVIDDFIKEYADKV